MVSKLIKVQKVLCGGFPAHSAGQPVPLPGGNHIPYRTMYLNGSVVLDLYFFWLFLSFLHNDVLLILANGMDQLTACLCCRNI